MVARSMRVDIKQLSNINNVATNVASTRINHLVTLGETTMNYIAAAIIFAILIAPALFNGLIRMVCHVAYTPQYQSVPTSEDLART